MKQGIHVGCDFTQLFSHQGFTFSGHVEVAAVAATNSQAQLFNPNASNTQFNVKKIWASLSAAGDILVSRYNTQLTTDGGQVLALLASAPAGHSHVRQQTNNGLLGTHLMRFSLPAAQTVDLDVDFLISVGPNTGIIVQAVTQNIGLNVTFAGIESN